MDLLGLCVLLLAQICLCLYVMLSRVDDVAGVPMSEGDVEWDGKYLGTVEVRIDGDWRGKGRVRYGYWSCPKDLIGWSVSIQEPEAVADMCAWPTNGMHFNGARRTREIHAGKQSTPRS